MHAWCWHTMAVVGYCWLLLVAAVVSLIVSGCCSCCWLLWLLVAAVAFDCQLLAAVVVGWLLCCWLQQEQPRKLELLARRAALLHRVSALTKCSQI